MSLAAHLFSPAYRSTSSEVLDKGVSTGMGRNDSGDQHSEFSSLCLQKTGVFSSSDRSATLRHIELRHIVVSSGRVLLISMFFHTWRYSDFLGEKDLSLRSLLFQLRPAPYIFMMIFRIRLLRYLTSNSTVTNPERSVSNSTTLFKLTQRLISTSTRVIRLRDVNSFVCLGVDFRQSQFHLSIQPASSPACLHS